MANQACYSIGSGPDDESFAQTGVTRNWIMLQHLECEVYRAALIAQFGVPPEGSRLAIRTSAHDFGSYTNVEYKFDSDAASHIAYFENIENGLSKWLDANFTAPVRYDLDLQPIQGSTRPAIDCVTAALITSMRLASDGYATEREHLAIANLSIAYPSCAALAREQLRTLGIGIDADIAITACDIAK